MTDRFAAEYSDDAPDDASDDFSGKSDVSDLNDCSNLTNPSILPQPYKHSILSATYKSKPEDFEVNEIMDIEFSGAGEHLWLHIQKVGMNTIYVAKLLSKWAGIPLRDVGFSGQKDRSAVTTQWFSLRIPKQQLPEHDFAKFAQNQSKHESLEVLEVINQHWHSKKLNRGTHRANQFVITLLQVIADTDKVDSQLKQIAQHGVPNYFGEQRFGHGGNNLTLALEWFEKGTVQGRKLHPKRDRERISMLLSASRSVIFNQILAYRVRTKSWTGGLNGEVFNLAGTNSVFSSDIIDDTLLERIESGDIHPTGVMWGINNDKVQGDVLKLEKEVVQANSILQTLASGLEQKGIKASRRSLRLKVEDLRWRWLEDTPEQNTLQLTFTLPTGSFATSVLMAIVANLNYSQSPQEELRR